LTDPVLIAKRLRKLREYVRLLRILRGRPLEEFIEDPFVIGNVERYLQLAIQVVLDICNHIVADDRLGAVEEYRDTIRLLGQNGYLQPGLVQRLTPMAGLRNILVHDYMDVDRNRIHALLQDCLEDFEQFATQIGQRL
jgi:uncharacterized protein YutE (UPF0331/DUF86 family)